VKEDEEDDQSHGSIFLQDNKPGDKEEEQDDEADVDVDNCFVVDPASKGSNRIKRFSEASSS